MINARPQQPLRTTHSSQRTEQVCTQLFTSFMYAVGQVPFPVGPHLLHRIQFGRVTRKPVNMQPRLSGQELLDLCASVDLPTIPNDKDMSLQMPQQVSQKIDYLRPSDIVSMAPRIQPKSATSRRNRQDANDRYFVAPIAMAQDRGLANRRPCPANVRDQKKPALVEKSQMGTKPFGLFLYAARPASSTGGSFPHHAATPSCPVSGNSNSVQHVTTARPRQRCTALRIVWRSISGCVSRSTDQWSVRLPRLLPATLPVDHFFAQALNDAAVPIRRALLSLAFLFPDRPGSIGQRCSRMHLLPWPHREKACPLAIKLMPDTCVTPTVCMFHMVSCQEYSMYPLLVKGQ